MSTDQKVFKTYSFYDTKKRRLAIFGKRVNDTTLEITTITCSKKDQFNKKKANEMFTQGEIKNPVETVYIGKGSNIGKEFINYCRAYHKIMVEEVVSRTKLISPMLL